METVMRKFQKIWGDRGCRRQHHSKEELYGGYTLLRNHDMTVMMPEKQSKKKMKQSRVAPHGCLSVYVGPERKRFVIKIEHARHPRFMALLEDAENENGNSLHNDGPIYLPCDVDMFHEALAEIMTANFESSVSDSPISSNRSAKHSWARQLFKIPRVPRPDKDYGCIHDAGEEILDIFTHEAKTITQSEAQSNVFEIDDSGEEDDNDSHRTHVA